MKSLRVSQHAKSMPYNRLPLLYALFYGPKLGQVRSDFTLIGSLGQNDEAYSWPNNFL
jgi:hypothetical protein